MDGKDYQQIAEILKKSAKSIDNALQRIKKKTKFVCIKAVNGTRTRDLRLTKATLYHLSYNSISK